MYGKNIIVSKCHRIRPIAKDELFCNLTLVLQPHRHLPKGTKHAQTRLLLLLLLEGVLQPLPLLLLLKLPAGPPICPTYGLSKPPGGDGPSVSVFQCAESCQTRPKRARWRRHGDQTVASETLQDAGGINTGGKSAGCRSHGS